MAQAEPGTVLHTAIAANLEALEHVLAKAHECAQVANHDMHNLSQNAAIGGVSMLESLLAQATALYGAAIALHRNHQ